MPLSVDSQMIAARLVLDKLYKLDRNVCVAGGAPRNWLEAKPARDLDFFLHIPESADVPNILRALLDEVVTPVGDDPSYTGEYIRGVWQYERYGLEHQFIILQKPCYPREVASRFTCNIGQVAYNRHGYVNTVAYTEGHRNKRMTFDFRTHGYREDYLSKMLDYYPDYTVDMDSIQFPDNMRPENEPNTVRTNDTIDFSVPTRPSPPILGTGISF